MRGHALIRLALISLAVTVSSAFMVPGAQADDEPPGVVDAQLQGEGAAIDALTHSEIDVRTGQGAPFGFTVTPACPGNDANVGGPYDVSCDFLTHACPSQGRGDGPMTWVWRRPLLSGGAPAGPWIRVGDSCTQKLPGNELSLGDVRRAFREVGFARPRLLSQPHGGWALVNLDTYYAVAWPDVGVAPGQVAVVELLGHRVGIRPKVVSYFYDFGDGDHERTADPGGPYPVGKVRHAYRRTGEVRVGVTARYSADFSVDGGAFRGLDDTVDIAGPSRTLRVYQARARLIPSEQE